jgi:hypothetical protein
LRPKLLAESSDIIFGVEGADIVDALVAEGAAVDLVEINQNVTALLSESY